MNLSGLQKTTLLDYPGKVACTVFTGGCNFSCPYCHNASLVLENNLENSFSEETFYKFLDKRKGILDGVCITGGEPLIHQDVVPFIKKIKEKGYLIKLDTNGSYPEKLKELVETKLIDYVAMDVKNAPNSYRLAAGHPTLDQDKIDSSIQFLLENHVAYEFRTTLVKGLHTVEDIVAIGEWIKGANKYFLQNYSDSGDTIAARKGNGNIFSSFSDKELINFQEKIRKNVSNVEIRGV